ncbi:alaserpin-like isoform X2 [Maniola jurtina]|uniref:alaserpin-like isoform X2 n=1 Tax=Maniola jurtina TaxID=191418 RepID=UPI001E68D65B|nr:alaserpin-like isoform X2 [Maniola jurtina]
MKTFILFFLAFAVMASGDEKELENLLYEGNNKLTARMFTEVAKANSGKSFVLSAYSVLTPLAQLSLASVDEAHDELLETIGMPNDNTTKEVFSLANAKVRALKGITLKTASKIYVADKYELNDKFAEDTRTIFGSEVQSINFLESENAANEVNAWVEEQTNNRIKDLVDPESLTADSRALLVNAIYFKGIWKYQFDKSRTLDYTFHVNKDATTQVRMMYRKGDFRYAQSNELKSQIIEIPYEGDESSLVIVLPLNMQDSNEVQEILKDPNVIEKALENMYETEVELYLPQFKIETTTDLIEILTKMNVKRMFDPDRAKLSNLLKGTADCLAIDSAKQKAFIEVNEEGAEAAAANEFGVGSYITSVGFQPQVIRFICDHPFFFYLRGSQYTLFNGAYYSS